MQLEQALTLKPNTLIYCPKDRGQPPYRATVHSVSQTENCNPYGVRYVWVTVVHPRGTKHVWPSNRISK